MDRREISNGYDLIKGYQEIPYEDFLGVIKDQASKLINEGFHISNMVIDLGTCHLIQGATLTLQAKRSETDGEMAVRRAEAKFYAIQADLVDSIRAVQVALKELSPEERQKLSNYANRLQEIIDESA